MTDEEIDERLLELLAARAQRSEAVALNTMVATCGYTDPAVAVGLMESFGIGAAFSRVYKNWWASEAEGWHEVKIADTLPKAVALAAIAYMEQSRCA